MATHLQAMLQAIARAASICVEEGDFRADLDAEQFAFECLGALLSYHHFGRLMSREDAEDRVVEAFPAICGRAIPA